MRPLPTRPMAPPDAEPGGPRTPTPNRHPPPRIPATAIIHQEGVIAVIAVVGLWLRDRGVLEAVRPLTGLGSSILIGLAVGAAGFGLLWLLRRLEPLVELESWQREMVGGWTFADAFLVALFSGLAEEALLRALLQPLIGLFPAALLFAVLHVIPDRRLWLWPVVALGLGIVLGLLFETAGYPAAAAAHVAINALSLLRLQRARVR